MSAARARRAGFTLAEVAITLLIVSMGLVLVLQGLTTAKQSAAATHYRKVARELAGLTLGQLESGLFQEDLDSSSARGDTLSGNYAEEGYEDFSYELVLGDEQFREQDGKYDENGAYHDTWAYQREQERENDDDEEEEVAQPFQKARIRVTFPKLGEAENFLVVERWIPWELVYGSEEGATTSANDSGEEAEQ